jgi:predicted RNA binding protein YcfA (HicA-like mRNA interferase family)
MGTAEKLLERMRASKADWGQDDLHTLYSGFGFSCKEGSRHRLYTHPKLPGVLATVARHNSLAPGYVATAIRNIDALRNLE